MLVCTACQSPVPSLFHQYSPGNIRLTGCTNCAAIADPFVEFDHTILAIDLLLDKPSVFRHVVFNYAGRMEVSRTTESPTPQHPQPQHRWRPWIGLALVLLACQATARLLAGPASAAATAIGRPWQNVIGPPQSVQISLQGWAFALLQSCIELIVMTGLCYVLSHGWSYCSTRLLLNIRPSRRSQSPGAQVLTTFEATARSLILGLLPSSLCVALCIWDYSRLFISPTFLILLLVVRMSARALAVQWNHPVPVSAGIYVLSLALVRRGWLLLFSLAS
ncbi:hypothetical protein CAOG_02616 [Capsaspora owczarzaki ATCC 30864]|uniref:Protein ARV n=1 Tax=Capsaspora owczarzaki (strain ATCC 30864) TaxID=595528 RepID=A0A0D2U8T9_CAPO3|nr:hypothetical protein CAOG_02616 [Capsaspora owczarzaki ATCC 30864]KJE91486.1 hypothetical protein CAOG_002616 [Capsaspora owczarzaki ATCC 30864]|eukprot:XP_004349366.1 hypothetical protein CAOG_02616 [Capsaspora owczarzaki ATCC 30864]